MTVSDLTRGAKYSFTVTGNDAGGRLGEESVSSEIVTFDSKAISFVNELICNHFSISGFRVSVFIFWFCAYVTLVSLRVRICMCFPIVCLHIMYRIFACKLPDWYMSIYVHRTDNSTVTQWLNCE